jgi:hypothetical protein
MESQETCVNPIQILVLGIGVLLAWYAIKGDTPIDMLRKVLPPNTGTKKKGA